MFQEMFDLKWNSYTENIKEILHELMISSEFTDVTLVTDDKKQYNAHKFILCSSSLVFKSIISDLTMLNPLIYLRGVHSRELESILKFIYMGETTLHKDRMNEFLDVARSLDIKELGNIMKEENGQWFGNQPVDCSTEIHSTGFEFSDLKNNVISPSETSKDEWKQKINRNLSQVEISKLSSLQKGMTANQKKNISLFECVDCGSKFSNDFAFNRHVSKGHKSGKYPCEQCNYKANHTSNLYKHMKSVHKEEKF